MISLGISVTNLLFIWQGSPAGLSMDSFLEGSTMSFASQPNYSMTVRKSLFPSGH